MHNSEWKEEWFVNLFQFLSIEFSISRFPGACIVNERSSGSESTETKCKQNQLFGARSSIQNNCGFSICWNG